MNRNARGNVTVEFALSFVLLFTIFTGSFRMGYAYHTYNRLQTAVRTAARYAATHTYDSNTGTPSDEYTAAVRNMVLYNSPTAGTDAVVPGLKPEQVSVSITMERRTPVLVTVSIEGYEIDTILSAMRLNGKPSAAFPYMGRYAP